MEQHVGQLENGAVFVNGVKTLDTAGGNWVPHPRFPGVSTKHLFVGADSTGKMSVMLVKVEPGMEIGDHAHEGRTELHQTVAGDGFAEVGGKRVAYAPGVVSLVPADVAHSVHAGNDGLVLLASFSPALS
jgi:quercetin dioxygenase-like cupin family protein